ncbi:MAG: aquaporin [Candidatus Curtissbacteria bacterium]|nr:aquaporin [Candidatus Curtissbacteria bacterium]
MAYKLFKEPQANWRAYVAEGIGTFVFVFVSLLAVLVNIFYGELGVVGVAIATGFVYTAMVFGTVHLSGGHLNPAITLALWLTRKINGVSAVIYILAQVTGGLLAALLLFLIFGQEGLKFSLGAQVTGGGVSMQLAVIVEAVLTAILVFGYFATLVDRRGPVSFGPLVVGFTVLCSFLVASPISGGVLNPAKVIGASLISGSYGALVVWIIGPLTGSLMGFVYDFVFVKKSSRSR